MAKTKKRTVYVCQACGYESPQWYGKCPNCGTWNQMEEVVLDATVRRSENSFSRQLPPTRLGEIKGEMEQRVLTRSIELDRVLGGGIVPGSLVLIGGDPGIGKSTLLLQISQQLSANGEDVLYVSGEESLTQIKLRANRLGFGEAKFYVYAQTDVEDILSVVHKLHPDYLIIDSIQTMIDPSKDAIAGSVSQVREVTNTLMHLAKSENITVFIVGHVTKEGNIAGPRILEHMVDTVLYFEGEKHNSYRILRSVKNRFGSTNEIGVFEMKDYGLVEVANPSELFLEERLEHASGSSIVVAIEGTRPILTEIQALLTPTAFGNARRASNGLDYSKVTLLLAVLEKRAGLMLQNQDVYLKSTGGVKLEEPAIDLAIAVAVASSYWERETEPTDAFVGEIGLTGEIRRVNNIRERIQEAEKLGFKKIFIPKGNLEGLKLKSTSIEVIGARTLKQVLNDVFPKRKE